MPAAKKEENKKVEVEVLDAEIDGKVKGETLEIDEKSADYFESIGYVKKL
ncbi:hypothetical protein WKH56_10615 [Priestia sp. SB1]|jgi:hypothetical protein|nr:hypothetical protein [Priestia megaterium]